MFFFYYLLESTTASSNNVIKKLHIKLSCGSLTWQGESWLLNWRNNVQKKKTLEAKERRFISSFEQQGAEMLCDDSEVVDFYLAKLPLSDPCFLSETWMEESCLVFVVNLSFCRTPERGSSECSKLGIRTLWPQPVQRQIGLPVLYVKLPARKRRPAGYYNSFVAAKLWRGPTV